MTPPSMLSRFRGCLLGGAVGDALGAPLEFSTLHEIVDDYGPEGPENLVAGGFPAGSFTDDTQMSLFVAEGLIHTLEQRRTTGSDPGIGPMLHAHWRWLVTQGSWPAGDTDPKNLESWLTHIPELKQGRAPGNTCLSSLRSGELGTPIEPINDSKGCGGVMRAAPVGLAWSDNPFAYACQVAALTHGHPTGWLAAGCLAQIIRELVGGAELEDAVEVALSELGRYPKHEEMLEALERAEAYAAMGAGLPEEVESLGAGWVAEEALAIAVFCAEVAPDMETALRLAVTHSGDSDSTGAIAGNLLGARHGIEDIPQRWLDQLEQRELVDTVATDLYHAVHEPKALDRKRWGIG